MNLWSAAISLSLAFFGREYHKALALCGAKSGREVDKAKACGFTVAAGEGKAPYFEQAELVLVCKKAYWQDLDPAIFWMRRSTGPAIPERITTACISERSWRS